MSTFQQTLAPTIKKTHHLERYRKVSGSIKENGPRGPQLRTTSRVSTAGPKAVHARASRVSTAGSKAGVPGPVAFPLLGQKRACQGQSRFHCWAKSGRARASRVSTAGSKAGVPGPVAFPLLGQKRACQGQSRFHCWAKSGRARVSRVSTAGSKAGMPGPVAFPWSLPGLDRASSMLPRGQRIGFFGPTKTLGQSGPTGATHLESVSTADHFIKLTAITTFKILLS